jgi:dephospho-CoA kinase
LPLPTEKMDASEILKTRDKNFTRYFSRPEFLQKIRSAFGQEAVDNIKAMNRKTLKRKIVEKSDLQRL